jgi:hypothetical protein
MGYELIWDSSESCDKVKEVDFRLQYTNIFFSLLSVMKSQLLEPFGHALASV